MSPLRLAATVTCLLILAACNQENPYAVKAKGDKAKAPPPKLLGVDPAKFDCQAFLAPAELTALAGGEVQFEPSDIVPADGTPRPCTYILPYVMTEEERKKEEKEQEKRIKNFEKNKGTMEDALAAWGVNRDKAYGFSLDCRDSAHDRAREWAASLEGRVPIKEVTVGKQAWEHSNAQLVFIDDKTHCSATISGPDEASRLALAQIVHGKLTLENAPMTPRAAK